MNTLIIVDESIQKQANDAAVEVMGPFAEGTFEVAWKKGSNQYYVASWAIPAAALEKFCDSLKVPIAANLIQITPKVGKKWLSGRGYAEKAVSGPPKALSRPQAAQPMPYDLAVKAEKKHKPKEEEDPKPPKEDDKNEGKGPGQGAG